MLFEVIRQKQKVRGNDSDNILYNTWNWLDHHLSRTRGSLLRFSEGNDRARR